MLTDWYDKQLCDSWIKMMGEYGDLPRRYFTLPMTLGIGKNIIKGEFYTSRIMRNHIVEYFNLHNSACRSSENSLIGLNCLDFGCGEGYLGRFLSKLGAKYLGVDGSSNFIKHAKSYPGSTKLRYEFVDLDDFNFRSKIDSIAEEFFGSQKANLIICHSIAEHLKDFKYFFFCLTDWLKSTCPEATISVICLNKNFFVSTETDCRTSIGNSASHSYHAIEVPDTQSFVKVNFLSDGILKKLVESQGLYVRDTLLFDKELYTGSIRETLEKKISFGYFGGPFRAYIITQ